MKALHPTHLNTEPSRCIFEWKMTWHFFKHSISKACSIWWLTGSVIGTWEPLASLDFTYLYHQSTTKPYCSYSDSVRGKREDTDTIQWSLGLSQLHSLQEPSTGSKKKQLKSSGLFHYQKKVQVFWPCINGTASSLGTPTSRWHFLSGAAILSWLCLSMWRLKRGLRKLLVTSYDYDALLISRWSSALKKVQTSEKSWSHEGEFWLQQVPGDMTIFLLPIF